MRTYLDCWANAAAALLPQSLAGEPELVEAPPRPLEKGSFGFTATLSGDLSGPFSVLLDATLLDVPLLGEEQEQKAGWCELLREVAEAAIGELHTRTGAECRVETFTPVEVEKNVTRAFLLKTAERSWTILIRDEVRAPKPVVAVQDPAVPTREPVHGSGPGMELLLDVELEATLRFGCREMPLGEVLDLGPGDVVQLDRNIADPVDLVVADKIVARGEVVLINGYFALRVTEIAEPRKRLESIRCIF